ncbi:hypothetical protein A1QO_03880 [Vibrio genomosp. F10 str. ZF-129]|uniref:Uncharacterized protein n=1 Tax=Vibrio genomosp. F10 str. ZF-129 TaxID=1187848 RepID=A0A1E5BIW6_9VIBR|nr:hypothetical protein [Vibrio genomosp. F10]OEE37252.1 hypothetical protein A1QO_03880 [Vibrio genomosp. F10 str. ZF-129]
MTNDYFKPCMHLALAEVSPNRDVDTESFVDKQLLIAATSSMSEKLKNASDSGRHGWWDNSVISIGGLYDLRNKAISNNDHVSVLNYTAMIAMRESHPESKKNTSA